MKMPGFSIFLIQLTPFQLGGLVVVGLASVVYAYSKRFGVIKLARLIPALFATYAIAHILFMVFLWQNHIAFPLNLEAMELTRLQHLRRIMSGLPLYPEPSSDFIALAYNPLSYYLTVPFAWIFGVNLFSMRLVAILGMLGAGVIIFLAVRKSTNSPWWGLMALGLFAAAYQVMDTYLDNAHADSWLLFSGLLGCYVIDQSFSQIDQTHSQKFKLLGVLVLISAFWFKQPGALFIVGALVYLTWKDGLRQSWQFWLLAAILVPGLYLIVPDWVFGPKFHYYTWEVPRQWSYFSPLTTLRRPLQFVIHTYPALAILAVSYFLLSLRQQFRSLSIWFFMLPIAMLSGIMAALDPGGNNNVFIPMGAWFIITGVMGLKHWGEHYKVLNQWGIHLLALGISFVLFAYNPQPVIISSQATTAYQDLVSFLRSLDAKVYALWLGQLQNGYEFYPTLHWIPLEDIIRGPGVNEKNHSTVRKLLEPALNPQGNAYVLMNYPLEQEKEGLLSPLTEKYILDTDLGERFANLSTLPKLYNLHYSRYLYRYKA